MDALPLVDVLLVFDANRDCEAYPCADAAAAYIEPVDVADDEYEFFRPDGTVVVAELPLPREQYMKRWVPGGTVAFRDSTTRNEARLRLLLDQSMTARGRADLVGQPVAVVVDALTPAPSSGAGRWRRIAAALRPRSRTHRP